MLIDKLEVKKDIFISCVIIILSWFFLKQVDAFEIVITYLHEHEEYELDELLLLLIIIGIVSIFFSTRRVLEANKINNQLKNINESLSKQVNEEIKKRQDNEALLLQESKLASMGEMIGNIAHQWRQPLNALGLVIQNIDYSYKTDDLDDEFMSKSVNKMTLLIKSMSKTIDDFRNFFLPNKEKEIFDLNIIVKETYSLYSSAFEYNNIDLEINLSDELMVNGFSGECSQTIINILNNAKDALLENKIKNPKVSISLFSINKYANIIISDNAGGIPNNIIKNIFNPYFTTKEEGKGTGIGLYMAKMIIEKNMEGKIIVENSKEGAIFTIKIPLYKEI